MSLDIRLPIGLFFSIVGTLLVLFGLFSDPEMYAQHSLGINVNVWWGLVLMAFGGTMQALAWSAKKNR